VTRVFADDAHHIFAAHNLACFAKAFDRSSNFHGKKEGTLVIMRERRPFEKKNIQGI